MAEPVIQPRDLFLNYGRHGPRALKCINLDIPPGDITVMLGPNGAGKTTFLKLLIGLVTPSAGAISLFGVNRQLLDGEKTRKIAFMGDTEEPPGDMRIADLIRVQRGAAPETNWKLFNRFVAKGKMKITRRRFGALSKGQKKWIRAGLAIASQPELLVMDEPAEGIDPLGRTHLYETIRSYINETGTTALITTHIIDDVERIADRVVVIERGRIAVQASLEALREQVRQVYVPGDRPLAEMPDGVSLIGRKEINGGRLIWLRSEGLEENTLAKLFGPQVSIRHVGLREYYLAITEYNPSNQWRVNV